MILVEKHFLDELPKGTRDFECQARVGMIPALLDRVDRLPCHSHDCGEFRLGPLALRTQYASRVLIEAIARHWVELCSYRTSPIDVMDITHQA